MTDREIGKKVLEQAERPLNAKEIFERACEMGLDKERNGGKILPHSLGSQLGEHNISNDKKQFYVINEEESPFRYWLKSREREFPPQKTLDAKEEDDEQSECSDTAEKQTIKEKDLHPLLVKFLDKDPDFKLLCKTIYHEKGKKDKGKRDKGKRDKGKRDKGKRDKGKRGEYMWNYPDIVGVYFPYNKYFPYNGYKERNFEIFTPYRSKKTQAFFL